MNWIDVYILRVEKLKIFCNYRVIYKEILVPIMMIEHSIFARSNSISSDQNVCLVSYNIMKEDLAKILLDQDDRANKFCSIISVFARSYDR